MSLTLADATKAAEIIQSLKNIGFKVRKNGSGSITVQHFIVRNSDYPPEMEEVENSDPLVLCDMEQARLLLEGYEISMRAR